MANKSSNKNAKSNKTAHVLNLLSGAGAAEAPRQQNGHAASHNTNRITEFVFMGICKCFLQI